MAGMRKLWSLPAVALLLAFWPSTGTAEELKLLAFGDSLTHGYGLEAGTTFPEQLEAALRAKGHTIVVLNSGNSGDTTAAGDAVIATPLLPCGRRSSLPPRAGCPQR